MEWQKNICTSIKKRDGRKKERNGHEESLQKAPRPNTYTTIEILIIQ